MCVCVCVCVRACVRACVRVCMQKRESERVCGNDLLCVLTFMEVTHPEREREKREREKIEG